MKYIEHTINEEEFCCVVKHRGKDYVTEIDYSEFEKYLNEEGHLIEDIPDCFKVKKLTVDQFAEKYGLQDVLIEFIESKKDLTRNLTLIASL